MGAGEKYWGITHGRFMEKKFEIGDHLYRITTGNLQNIEIRKGKVIDVIKAESEAQGTVTISYVLESTRNGCYVGYLGNYSETGGMGRALAEATFSASEDELFKKDEALEKLQNLLKE